MQRDRNHGYLEKQPSCKDDMAAKKKMLPRIHFAAGEPTKKGITSDMLRRKGSFPFPFVRRSISPFWL